MGKLTVTLVPTPDWRNPFGPLGLFFGYRDQAREKNWTYYSDQVLLGINTDVFETSPPDVIRVTVEWGGTPGGPSPPGGRSEEPLPSGD